MAPGATATAPTFAVRIELLVAGTAPPAQDEDVGSGRRRLGVISALQQLQLRDIIASLLVLDEASVAVTASAVREEVRPDTALLVAVADFGSDLAAAQGALLKMGRDMGWEDAQRALAGLTPPLVLRSAPTVDIVENTEVLPAAQHEGVPITLVVAAAMAVAVTLLLLLLCCFVIARRRGRVKVTRLPPPLATSQGGSKAPFKCRCPSPHPSMLRDLVETLRYELGVSGNMTDVVNQAAAHLRIDVRGKPLTELARECVAVMHGAEVRVQSTAAAASAEPDAWSRTAVASTSHWSVPAWGAEPNVAGGDGVTTIVNAQVVGVPMGIRVESIE